MSQRIPARYIGASPVILSQKRPGDPYLDANGLPLQPKFPGENGLRLDYGDTLMVDAVEVLGKTILVDSNPDPQKALPSLDLGAGLHLIPEHAGQDWKSLVQVKFPYGGDPMVRWQYEFHLGRMDFEPIGTYPDTSFSSPTPVATIAVSQSASITLSPEPQTPDESGA
jgi:hypothetical protein